MLTYEELEERNAQLENVALRDGAEKKALEWSNNEWANTFDAMMDLVIVVDADYRVVRVNKAMARALNRPADTIKGKMYWDIIYGKDQPIQDCPLILAEKTLRTHSKELAEGPLGGTFSLSASLIIGGGGRLQGYCLTLMDMTGYNHQQQKKRHADKLDAISTLSGVIAHEFNNLLTGIQGTTSLIMAGMDKSDPIFGKLQRVESYIETGHGLTKQLLGFIIGSKYEVEPTDINDLVEKTWDVFLDKKEGIKGQKRLEKDLWLTEVDADRIEQALLHLYSNAWQAMPKGGELNIETENVALDRNYADFFGLPEGDYIKLALTDTGEGMDYATQEMMFAPFFTTRSKGTGLGLAFTQRIVTKHRGVINVYSEKGHGTTVNVYLPASAKKTKGKRPAPSDEVMLGTETVLLVDDEKIIHDVGGEMLKEMGYQVYLANSGSEAVDIYSRHRGEIQLVILDMIMPDMDGGETYDTLLEMNPEIKVLLASGYSMTSQVTEILNRGFNDFIQKPFNMLRLSKKIRSILDPQDNGGPSPSPKPAGRIRSSL